MRTISAAALGLALLLPAQAGALEIKNIRSTYGPQGPTRADNKLLPGDSLFLMYDIVGLAIDQASGSAQFFVTMEIFDAKKKSIFKKDNNLNERLASLGGKT